MPDRKIGSRLQRLSCFSIPYLGRCPRLELRLHFWRSIHTLPRGFCGVLTYALIGAISGAWVSAATPLAEPPPKYRAA